MMRSAIVENGVVVNVIMGELAGSIPCGEAGIGWSYDGETFSAPPPPEPEPTSLPALSRRQLRLGLLSIDITSDMVEAEITATVDPVERAAAMIEWQDASVYERDHPLVADLASAFGLPAEQVDALWLWAAVL